MCSKSTLMTRYIPFDALKGFSGTISRCMMLSSKTWLYVPMNADKKATFHATLMEHRNQTFRILHKGRTVRAQNRAVTVAPI